MAKNINRTFNQIKSDILKCFQIKENWYRKEIINECLKYFNLSDDELKNNDSSSTLIQSMSLIGSVISSMLNNGDLSIDNGKVIRLGKDDNILIRSTRVLIFIKDYIIKNKKTDLNTLLNNAYSHFKTNTTPSTSDDNELKNIIEKQIMYLLNTNYIKQENNTYIFYKEHPYPNTEIGNCLSDCYFNGNTYDRFIEAINIKGGEFLEQYAVSLLSTYFKQSKNQILKSSVTGGSNDGGLDGIIEIIDELGYFERIFIQTKARNKIFVNVKEIREFYGAFIIEKGTRGIFVTNSNYHPHSLEFISKASNLIGIDGKQLYKIALNCNYGLIKKDNNLLLDDKIFIGGIK